MPIRVKRVYEPVEAKDGLRILVDGLWPRGLSKQNLQLDQWCKAIAPSAKLRQWFGHDPMRWDEFRRRYKLELASRADLVTELRHLGGRQTVTLLFAARDVEHNHAVALKEILQTVKLQPHGR